MEVISRSVGKNGINSHKDVAVVQTLINENLHLLLPLRILDVDGKCGTKTVDAISQFQSRVLDLKEPDGRVDPGGKTLNSLNEKRVKKVTPQDALLFSNLYGSMFVSATDSSYKFPIEPRPSQSYKQAPRSFGSNRSKARKHAGCDLYAPVGTPVLAMADGVVENGPYSFYLGTQAIDIKHSKFLARYGEISRAANGLKAGSKVKKGQVIGYVGELKGLNMSMLHLELFSGEIKGKLTDKNNKPYMRRSDLMDPTAILDGAK